MFVTLLLYLKKSLHMIEHNADVCRAFFWFAVISDRRRVDTILFFHLVEKKDGTTHSSFTLSCIVHGVIPWEISAYLIAHLSPGCVSLNVAGPMRTFLT